MFDYSWAALQVLLLPVRWVGPAESSNFPQSL